MFPTGTEVSPKVTEGALPVVRLFPVVEVFSVALAGEGVAIE